MTDCVVVVPLWRRTAHVRRVVEAFTSTAECRVLLVVSAGDQAVLDEVVRLGHAAAFDLLLVDGDGGDQGDYARKINAGYAASTEAFIFTAADDVVPRAGWFEAAIAAMREPCETCKYGHPTSIGVVGTNDLCNPRVVNGDHSTHTLVARWYADQGGCVDQSHVIYHEGYDHEYCDDELVETAKVRGAWAFAHDAVVEHHHPIHPERAIPDDETYQRGRSRTRHSRALFAARRRLWSPQMRQVGQFARRG